MQIIRAESQPTHTTDAKPPSLTISPMALNGQNALIVVLAKYDRKPQPSWENMSLNSLTSCL